MVNIKQDKKESLAAFTKRFKNSKDIMENQHGKLKWSQHTKNLAKYYELKIEKVKLDQEESHYKSIAYTFIQGTDHRRTWKIVVN